MIVRGEDSPIAIVLRGDHDLNEIKAEKLPGVRVPLEFAEDEEIVRSVGCPPGSIGPVNLSIPFFVDPYAASIGDFCCGANEEGRHHVNVNWDRDVEISPDRIIDARNVIEGEPAPSGQGTLRFLKGIEAGHIFQLGQVYSEPMNATVLDRNGKPLVPIMGCYGMGVTRLVAAIIEQNHDEVGIKWPTPVAPFLIHIVALNYGKSESVKAAADELYKACLDQDMEVLLDDTDDRPGVKFADADLIGLPYRITVGERALADGNVEYKARRSRGSDRRATGRDPDPHRARGRQRRELIMYRRTGSASRSRRLRSPLMILGLGLTLVAGNLSAAASLEPDPALRDKLAATLAADHTDTDVFDAQVWLMASDQRLGRYIGDQQKRLDLLRLVYREAQRNDLDPDLVLAVMQVESAFNRYAISKVGAQGLMQIMPFWRFELGRPQDNLTEVETNIIYGTTILAHYLEVSRGDLVDALARYNGSRGRLDYPELVVTAWRKRWRHKSSSELPELLSSCANYGLEACRYR